MKETLFDAFSIYQTHIFENRNILRPNRLPENRYIYPVEITRISSILHQNVLRK